MQKFKVIYVDGETLTETVTDGTWTTIIERFDNLAKDRALVSVECLGNS